MVPVNTPVSMSMVPLPVPLQVPPVVPVLNVVEAPWHITAAPNTGGIAAATVNVWVAIPHEVE